jgi:hypothetical protein
MGNILRNQCRFFSIPTEFVEAGNLGDCSPSALKLYIALYYFGQKHTAVRLEFSNAQLQSYVRLDTKSIQLARRQLGDRRLITIRKGALGVYTYTLLNPTTGEPLPSPEGRTGLRRYYSPVKEQSMNQPSQAVDSNTHHNTHPKQATAPLAFRCFSCKRTEFWTRGSDRICMRCHPDPRSTGPQRETYSPTAAEMGF